MFDARWNRLIGLNRDFFSGQTSISPASSALSRQLPNLTLNLIRLFRQLNCSRACFNDLLTALSRVFMVVRCK